MIKGHWQVRLEPEFQWNFPDSGPASEQHLLELLREIAGPTTTGQRVTVQFIHTPEWYYEHRKEQGKPLGQ